MKTFLLTTFVVLVIVSAYVAGARFGVYQFQLMNSAAKASVLAGELEALRSGKASLLIPGKEVELDGFLIQHGIFLDSGTPWLFWPESSVFENKRYMVKILAYRKEYTSKAVDESLRKEAMNVLERYMK